MIRIFPALFCLLWMIASGASEDTAITGVVFADINRNGIQEQGEAGLASVAVSDGVQIVYTDHQGRYAIQPTAISRHLFVIKPADFSLPETEYHVPRFSYPLLNRPQRADFPLYPQTEAERFSILVLADTQVKSQRDIGYLSKDIMAAIPSDGDQALALNLGDLVDDRLDLYPQLNRELSRMGVPIFSLPGNHDRNLDTTDDFASTAGYQDVYGPETYAFNYAGVNFLMFDNVLHMTDGSYTGGIREDQFTFIQQWLKNIQHDEQIVVAMHIPFVEPRGRDIFRSADSHRLLTMLASYSRVLILAGHGHKQAHFYLPVEGRSQPVHLYMVGAASGSFWSGAYNNQGVPDTTMADGTPNGYAVIDFKPDGYHVHYHAAGEEKNQTIRLMGPGIVPKGSYPNAWLYANVFNGSEKTEVQVRVDGGEWQLMQHSKEADPWAQWLYVNHLAEDSVEADSTHPSTDRPSPPVASTHLWKFRVPTDLDIGSHTLEVKAVDPWGGEWQARKVYNIIPPVPQAAD